MNRSTNEAEEMVNATEQIWHEFHERLRAFVARRVDNEADVKDILQTVFLRLHQNLASLNHADHLAFWLFQVTRHAVADYYRTAERQREIPTDFRLEPELDLDSPYSSLITDPSDADDHRAKVIKELSSCLRPLTQHLPAHYHEAITLVELEGLTRHEAAKQVGLSVSGMKSRVQRGRQMLKTLLLEYCQIELDCRGSVINCEPHKKHSNCKNDKTLSL
jgi:RNA polymerase sigma-70 factor (ECF subfamily)